MAHPAERVGKRKRAFSCFRVVVVAILAMAVNACEVRPKAGAVSGPVSQWPPEPAHGNRHMIAAAHPLAARAGREILRSGGGVIDAAIAAQMVLTLVEPQSSGIGGGAFMLAYYASADAGHAYDGRETAPMAVTPDLFLKADSAPMKFYDAVIVEKLSKIPSDGRGAWGIGRAKIDQQNTCPICCFRQKASLKFHGTRDGYARC